MKSYEEIGFKGCLSGYLRRTRYIKSLCGYAARLIIMLLMSIQSSAASYEGNAENDASDLSGFSLKELTRQGYKSLEQSDYDAALKYYMAAISAGNDRLTGKEMREYIKVLNNVGYIYLFDRCNPEGAYPYLIHARELAEKAGENDLLGAVLDNMAKVHDDFGDAEKAIEFYNQAMAHAAQSTTEVSGTIQLMVFNDMVNCAMAHDMVDRIGPSLEIFAMLPEYTIPMGKYSRNMCRALQLLIRGNIEEATSLAKESERYIDSKVDHARYVSGHNITMANLYHMRGMQDSAMICLKRALDNSRGYRLTDLMPRIYKGMAKVEESRGDSLESRRLRLMAYETDESIHSSKQYATLNNIEATQRIDALNVMLREAEIRHSHRVTMIWVLSVGLALIAILLVYITIRNQRLAASLRELVARHKASISAEELNDRLRREYETEILHLRQELEKKSLSSGGYKTDDMSAPRRSPIPIDDKERLRIVGKVKDIFDRSQEIYDPDFSLERLAELSGTKARYLSQLINDTIGKSFSMMLAEARIKHACKLMLSPDFKKTKTIESIAGEVGYRSRTHFSSVFKKITGVTPLQYVAMST